MALAKWVAEPGNASQKNWRTGSYISIATIIAVHTKHQNQYLPVDLFSM